MCNALTILAIGLLWMLHGVGQYVDKQKQDDERN